jgi:hypothetical protein
LRPLVPTDLLEPVHDSRDPAVPPQDDLQAAPYPLGSESCRGDFRREGLVNSCLDAKAVLADERLVGRKGDAGERRYARRNLVHPIETALGVEPRVLPGELRRIGEHLLQCCVTARIAQIADGDFHLRGAARYARHGVRQTQPEEVVAVDAPKSPRLATAP